MISYVTGVLTEIYDKMVVLEAGGIGYGINVPSTVISSLPGIGGGVKLYTHFHVTEDSQKLYGFLSPSDRELFCSLITISGIGPKVALGIMSYMSPDALRIAVLSEDEKSLSKVPGLGPKTAKKVILELKDKFSINDISPSGSDSFATATPGAREDALAAMVAMGYSASQALTAIEGIGDISGMDSGEILGLALRRMVR